jgi:hypothetical protein
MKKIYVITAGAFFCSAAIAADPVTTAYDEAFASARVTLDLQKECEASVKKNDIGPCKTALKAYENFRAKAKKFTASVDSKDLFNHVTPQQMENLTAMNQKIGESMDYVNQYLEASK